MDQDVMGAIRDMLTARKVLCLAAIIDGEPAASLLPYAVASDLQGVYVQASTLAKHSRALDAGAKVSLLVHGLDTENVDPLQVPRLMIEAVVEPLERNTDAFNAASRVFVGRLPSAEVALGFEDFMLYRLRFVRGRFVAGFAQAYDISVEVFQDIARLD
ncbi:MAG: pyridoxamine 5'-phosphate oxidase family protein [Bacteroidales bacterium]